MVLTVGNLAGVGYVQYFKLTVTGTGGGGTLTDSDPGSPFATSNGSVDYIPVDANGTTTLKFTPAMGTTPDFKFNVLAATTNNGTAALSPVTTPASGEIFYGTPPAITPATSTQYYQISTGFNAINSFLTMVTDSQSGATFSTAGSTAVSAASSNDTVTIPVGSYHDASGSFYALRGRCSGNITYAADASHERHANGRVAQSWQHRQRSCDRYASRSISRPE